ncbi:MAG: hypothetical protein MJ076_05615 [Clostridia bacterium]|nr:hypothetical protein [Clostridia bacterium]
MWRYFFVLFKGRFEQDGFAKQNGNLSVNGCRVRVRAAATVAAGESSSARQSENLSRKW